jgi:hypothetical protein
MQDTTKFIEHLKATGQFGQFKALRKELEAKGKEKLIAWQQAAAEFGWHPKWTPDSQDAADEPEPEADETIEQIAVEMGAVDLPTDFNWAYHNLHLDDKNLDGASAPSSFARRLVSYANSGPAYLKHFIEQANKHLGPEDGERDKALQDDRRKQMGLIDTFLERELDLLDDD